MIHSLAPVGRVAAQKNKKNSDVLPFSGLPLTAHTGSHQLVTLGEAEK